MRDVIQKVMEAERGAKRLIDLSRAEAEQMLSQARKEGQELMARMQRESRAEAAHIIETETQTAEQEKQQRLAQATVEIATQIQLEEPTKQRAVEEVIRCVCALHRPRTNEPGASSTFSNRQNSRPATAEQSAS